MSQPKTLHPDHAEELCRLLGTVEDWLLHCSSEVLDELGRFLANVGWTTTTPERLAAELIADLGDQAVALQPSTDTSSASETGST